MILYHGSNLKIESIDLSKSKPFKDFGKGFYLSDSESQALEMAKFKTQLYGGFAVVSKFEFDKDAFNSADCQKLIFDGYSEEWVDFILENRNGLNSKIYDFVYGPIADDKVGLQLNRFKDGIINKNQLIEMLKFHRGITFQYYFGTLKSLQFLQKI